MLFLIAFPVCKAQSVPGIGAYSEDPKGILLSAEKAVSKLKNISYDATFEGTGWLSTVTAPIRGKVTLANIGGSHLDLKLAAEGFDFDVKKGSFVPFNATYSNKTISKLSNSKKVVFRQVISENKPDERDFSFITGRLGRSFSYLTVFEFLGNTNFQDLVKSSVLAYEGLAEVNEVVCHVVYAENPGLSGRTIKERLFFGKNDYLLRKREEISISDKGRYGGTVLKLSNLRFNTQISPRSFTTELPKGYTVKEFPVSQKQSFLSIGAVAPEWTLKDAAGETHSLLDYKGKVVVMDFWATWCMPCLKSMPEMEEIHRRFEKRGVRVLGINTSEEGNAIAYFKDKNYAYQLLLNGETIESKYPVPALPTIYIIGVNGEIIYADNTSKINLPNFIENYLKKHNM